MKATQPVVDEFVNLHERYVKAHQRMALLQKTAIEGLLHIGVGCVNEASRQEFKTLKAEIEETLNAMDEICDRLH
ncbi:MAG: hypothetical protein JW954_01325 [Dehalococcoidaceae bacterium]|nr:hypothetical protein [Dehalococcoidaceae bacterium]